MTVCEGEGGVAISYETANRPDPFLALNLTEERVASPDKPSSEAEFGKFGRLPGSG